MKQYIEKLKQEMSELIDILCKAHTISLVSLGLAGWFVCPLLAISGLFAKTYRHFKNKKKQIIWNNIAAYSN